MAERLKQKRANAVRARAMTARLDRVEAQLAVLSKPAADEARRDARFFYRAVSWLERLWLTRLLVLVLGLLAGLTFLGFLDERQARQEERITRAYQTLSSPTAGGTSKIRALTLLHGAGKALTGFDLSGPADNPVLLDRLALTNADFTTIALQNVTFHDSTLDNTRITASDLRRFRFDGLISGELDRVDASGSEWNHWGRSLPKGAKTAPLFVFTSNFDYAVINVATDRLPPTDTSTDTPTNAAPRTGPPSPEREFQLHDSSLRCGLVIDPRPDAQLFYNVNLSGTHFDFIAPLVATDSTDDTGRNIVVLQERPSPLFASLDNPTTARALFFESWYFSDNPPTGLPPAALATLESRDRADFLAACRQGAAQSLTTSDWTRHNSPSALCASLARTPESCSPAGITPDTPIAPAIRARTPYDNRYDLGIQPGP